MNLGLKIGLRNWYNPFNGCPISLTKIYDTPDAVALATLLQPLANGHVTTEPQTVDIALRIRGTYYGNYSAAGGF